MDLSKVSKTTNVLDLSRSEVVDCDLADLRDHPALEQLYLIRTRVTDAGLQFLEGIKTLTWLDLTGTRVTSKGLARIRAALPGCHVYC